MRRIIIEDINTIYDELEKLRNVTDDAIEIVLADEVDVKNISNSIAMDTKNYIKYTSGRCVVWGIRGAGSSTEEIAITFPITLLRADYNITLTAQGTSALQLNAAKFNASTITTSGFSYSPQGWGGSATSATTSQANWIYWKVEGWWREPQTMENAIDSFIYERLDAFDFNQIANDMYNLNALEIGALQYFWSTPSDSWALWGGTILADVEYPDYAAWVDKHDPTLRVDEEHCKTPGTAGDFLRSVGYGDDVVGTHRDDAIRNINGSYTFRGVYGDNGSSVGLQGVYNAFKSSENKQETSWGTAMGNTAATINIVFNASDSVPTSDENRPVYTACNLYIKVKSSSGDLNSVVLEKLSNNDIIVLDGETGEIHINPTPAELEEFKAKKQKFDNYKAELLKLIGTKSESVDGVEIEICANIGSPNDVAAVNKNDAEGIGLFRSEFLYMDGHRLPTEDEQFEAYKAAVEGLNGKRVIIRTLDVGGDKEIPYLNIPKEENPFLGYRAIRVCLAETDMFKTQLRALLRSSAFGKLAIMFPMIISVKEIIDAKKLLAECKAELIAEGHTISDDIEIGVMIETPAAIMVGDMLAQEVDFFSIGTNDLTQYILAADRMNTKIAYLYDTLNPAVLRAIKQIADYAHNAGIWIGICGEAGADTRLTGFFMAIGIDELSVSPGAVLEVRKTVQSINVAEEKKKLDEFLTNC
ncbi:MAG: phosphoenolpyruvate--protein phosphotransferase [Epulopiscium sp. Nele67-Bin004]|nr:MAG: phosphoenolpyruvate--protein phosphotransferase [Epulopiscium sp. Nele67-Bin004]